MQVHATSARTYATSCYPSIIKHMQPLLTGYGMTMMQKQIVAGGNYGVATVSLTSMDDGDLQYPDTRPFPFVDPDVADHPRFQTANELRSVVPRHQQEDVRCFQVRILHTITDKPTNPHFVLLHDKVEGRECYRCHTCTCGSGVRCGVPCRHFWAVLRSSSEATFHEGLVNDLWFKEAQPLTDSPIKLHTFDNPTNQSPPVVLVYQRPLYPAPMEGSEELMDTDQRAKCEQLVKDLTLKRLHGILLGEAKKAIERAIAVNLEGGLLSTLRGYATEHAAIEDTEGNVDIEEIGNPEVVRGKGRPRGSTKRKHDGNRPPPRLRQPLHALDNRQPTEDGVADASGSAAIAVQPDAPVQDPHLTAGEPVAAHPKPKKPRKCGVCGEITFHNARTCPQRAAGAAGH